MNKTAEQAKFDNLCAKLASASDKNKVNCEEIKRLMPHFYRTQTNLLIDFRLFDTSRNISRFRNLDKNPAKFIIYWFLVSKDLQIRLTPILEDILKIKMSERLVLEKLRNDSIMLFKSESKQ